MLKNNTGLVPQGIRRLYALWLATIMAAAAAPATAALPGPINSDPLIQRGISPRILDVAIVPMSQGLRYEAKVVYHLLGSCWCRGRVLVHSVWLSIKWVRQV